MDPRNYEPAQYVPSGLGLAGFPLAGPGIGTYMWGPGVGSYVPEISSVAPGTAIGHVGHGPRGYTRSDERVLDEVCERLTLNPVIDAREVSVEVKDGEVVLTGEVENRQMKRMAEDVAFSVWGAKDVSNQIRIAPVDQE